jgi:DnaK suppressor protein
MTRHGKVREQLEAELHEVLSTNARLTDHLRNVDRTLPKDWADLGQFLENDEVLEALESRSRDRIEELRQAIVRIDAGNYDRCGNCGRTIEAGRLEVLPTTSICAGCAGGGEAEG